MTDLVVRGGIVVTARGEQPADVAIEGGRITAVAPGLPGGRDEIDATGLHLLPGVVDIHLHFNEPGHESWEGAATGSRALAAGGGTTFADMPLNSVPCTVDVVQFDRKRSALEAASIADFAIWGGLTPQSIPQMEEMAARGVVGFKAFMCDSGLPEFPHVDLDSLRRGMEVAARLGSIVAVHAESQEMTSLLASALTAGDVRSFLKSRPIEAENIAIGLALTCARETGARLHIVHISSGQGVRLAAYAKELGVDVTIETCPHYLFFTEDDVERLGALAKCAPPLRPVDEQEGLWETVLDGTLDIIASDHSPSEPSMKQCGFRQAWGGIAGVQSTLPVLLDRGHHARGLALSRIAGLLATTPARRFGLQGKGDIAPGFDADLALVDLRATTQLRAEDLLQRHAISPYIGETFQGVVRRTIRRGETIYLDGRIVSETRGHFIAATGTHA